MSARVEAVHAGPYHKMSKPSQLSIRLLAGLGVAGDAHMGETVQHRSRVMRDASQPNLRQVHLMHAELLDELNTRGFNLSPGLLGENITTRGIDLLALPQGAQLRLGADAVIAITGLRNPCVQLDRLRPGLMAATLDKDARGGLIRKAGVMAIVRTSGDIWPGDAIHIALPPPPHTALRVV
jgi:MOSC domain-containing protein YiiM